MKMVVSSYVLTQAALFVGWLIGVFDVSALLALLPTIIALSILVLMFVLLKTLDYMLNLEEDDEYADILGLDDHIGEEKEGLNGAN